MKPSKISTGNAGKRKTVPSMITIAPDEPERGPRIPPSRKRFAAESERAKYEAPQPPQAVPSLANELQQPLSQLTNIDPNTLLNLIINLQQQSAAPLMPEQPPQPGSAQQQLMEVLSALAPNVLPSIHPASNIPPISASGVQLPPNLNLTPELIATAAALLNQPVPPIAPLAPQPSSLPPGVSPPIAFGGVPPAKLPSAPYPIASAPRPPASQLPRNSSSELLSIPKPSAGILKRPPPAPSTAHHEILKKHNEEYQRQQTMKTALSLVSGRWGSYVVGDSHHGNFILPVLPSFADEKGPPKTAGSDIAAQ